MDTIPNDNVSMIADFQFCSCLVRDSEESVVNPGEKYTEASDVGVGIAFICLLHAVSRHPDPDRLKYWKGLKPTSSPL